MNIDDVVKTLKEEKLEKESLEFQIANGHILLDVIGIERHDNLAVRLQALTNYFTNKYGDAIPGEHRIDLFGNSIKKEN